MKAVTAAIEYNGDEWKVELIPLQSLRLWCDNREVKGVGWDRQRLTAPLPCLPALEALTMALRKALSIAESGSK